MGKVKCVYVCMVGKVRCVQVKDIGGEDPGYFYWGMYSVHGMCVPV